MEPEGNVGAAGQTGAIRAVPPHREQERADAEQEHEAEDQVARIFGRIAKRGDKLQLKGGPLRTRVRNDINEQMELVWRDEVSSKQALDNAMQKANSGNRK